MGRKVHPLGFRLGIVQDWQAKWYADTNYAEVLQEDLTIRRAIQTKYPDAAISRVEIDRQAKEVTVTIHTARPGIVIGRGGQRVDEFNSYLEKTTGKKVRLNIQEIRQAELDAFLVARTIADQIQRRISYRRAMKQAIFRTMQAGAKGIRINCSGRLGDSEIARRQTMHEGQVPLHTIRADIDYAFTEARTTLGRIGVKVWIYKGEILPEIRETEVEEPAAPGEELAEVSPEAPAPETPAEPETAPATPARTRRRAAATAEEKPAEEPPEVAEATAEKPTEAPAEAAEATAEKATDIPAEKSAPKRRKKVTPEAEEKTQEAVAEEGAKAETEAKAEDKPARTARKRSKQAEASTETPEAEASSIADQEDKDAAT